MSNLTLIWAVRHGLNDRLHRFSSHDVSISRGSRLITPLFTKREIFMYHYLNKGYKFLCFLWQFLPIGDFKSPLPVTRCRSKWLTWSREHYSDVIMSAMASQITSLTIVYSAVNSGADQRKCQRSASPVFVGGIHLWMLTCVILRTITNCNCFPINQALCNLCRVLKSLRNLITQLLGIMEVIMSGGNWSAKWSDIALNYYRT